MAKEYIEREALIAEYDRVHKGPAGGARKLMVDAPAVDAVEVVHGKYIHKGAWHIECSACGYVLAHIGEAQNYCPYCGAKMDGERKTE